MLRPAGLKWTQRELAILRADYARLGGTEGAEEIMWLAMRGALSDGVKKLHSSYYLPMTTTMAVALFEEEGADLPRGSIAGSKVAA